MENGRYKVDIYHRGLLIAKFNTLIRGEHNAVNCAAAAIVCHVVSVDMERAIYYISNFPGVKRRLELISKRNFCDVYYDYAHHPCEINATYSALSEIGYKRILAVFSPHTYTRTQAFLSDFGGALAKFTKVIITDIYGARECAIVGVTSSRLADEINLHGGDAHAFLPSDLNELIEEEKYDCVVLMGAGELEKIKRMVEDF
jgi:UDP-N-acetylmuramate--alanine ligase